MVYFNETCVNDVQRFCWGEVEWVHESGQDGQGKLSAGIVRLYPGGHQEKHFHMNEEQIIYVMKGKGVHMTDGTEKSINESMILYCRPYSEHEVINTGDEDLVMLIVYAPLKSDDTSNVNAPVADIGGLWTFDKDLAASICGRLHEMLRLDTAVHDSEGSTIASALSVNSFCMKCGLGGVCSGHECPAGDTDIMRAGVYICHLNVVTVEKPVVFDGGVAGCVRCGGFITSYPVDWQEIIAGMAFDTGKDVAELTETYMRLPYVPKSRLYAVEESVQAAAAYMMSESKRSAYEQELIIRDTQILKNYKEKVKLENALRAANRMLRENRLSMDTKATDCGTDGDEAFGVIGRVNKYIYDNCTDKLTLGSIADKFYLSPNYLSSLFNMINKMSLNDYINEMRLARAKIYLTTTDMQIKEIGRAVGFNSNSYFSEVFKRAEGMTPREYRFRFAKKRTHVQ